MPISQLLIRLFIIGLAYYLSGRIGLHLASFAGQVSLIWPPTGIAMFALLAWGPRMWPAIFMAAFLVNLPLGTSIAASLAIAVGNTLGPLLSSLYLGRLGFNNSFSTARDTLLYLGIGSLGGMAINATIGSTILVLDSVVELGAIQQVWLTWWLGDALGALILGPALLSLVSQSAGSFIKNFRLEAEIAWSGLILVAAVCLTPLSPFDKGLPPMLSFSIVIWLALRLNAAHATWSVVIVSAMALWGVFTNTGPFINHLNEVNITRLWSFMLIIGFATMLITSLRRQADQAYIAVTESEQRHKDAQEIAHIGHWEMDLKSNKLIWSDEIFRIFEIDPEQFRATYEAFLDEIHPDDRDMVNKTYSESVKNHTSYDIVHRLKMNDGRIKYVNERCRTIYDQDGKPERSVGTVQDITERTVAEKAIQRASREWTLVMDTLKDAIYLLDVNRRLVRANKAFYRLIQSTPNQAIGRHIVELIHPQGEIVPCPVCQAQENMQDSIITMEADHPDNPSGVPIEVRVTIVHDEDGDATGILMGIHDLTNTRKMDAEIRAQAKEKSAILESSGEGILGLDVNGNHTFVNTAAADLLGWPKEKILGEHGHTMWHYSRSDGSPYPEDECPIYAVLKNKISRRGEESFVRNDGTHFPVEFIGMPIIENDDVVGAVINFKDITERKKYEERLHQSLEQTVQVIGATLEKRDPYTSGHQLRVSELAIAIANDIGLNEDRVEGLYVSSIIHDLGKISVPAEILTKPGKLTDLEFELIRAHPKTGHDIIKHIDFPWPVAQIILQHHERLDGTGYPYGLKGDDVYIESRIIAVADVVEAMQSDRPYRPGLGIERALDEIQKNRGSRYDGAVVDSCIRLIEGKAFEFSNQKLI